MRRRRYKNQSTCDSIELGNTKGGGSSIEIVSYSSPHKKVERSSPNLIAVKERSESDVLYDFIRYMQSILT